MAPAATPEPREGVVCPFCGLYCDDLGIEMRPRDVAPVVTAKGCKLSKTRFAAVAAEDSPRIDGKKADFGEACDRAAKLLHKSDQPLVAGLAADIGGVKAAMSLADHIGAIVDHKASDDTFRNMLVMQDKGWIATTLGEVANRTDLLIVAGTDIVTRFPRFFERCVWNKRALVEPPPEKRDVVLIGKEFNNAAMRSPDGRRPKVIDCDVTRLGEIFGALRALYNGRTLQAGEIAGTPIKALAALVERIRKAKYGVLAWAVSDLRDPGGDLAVQAMCDLVTDINETSRFSCLPLGGSDNALGAGQVATWQAGFPLRISFARGYPEYDPRLNSWRRVIADNDVDAVLWLSCFGAEDIPFDSKIPTIVVGAPGTKFKREPAVFIPVGVPGVDHPGHVARMDSVASLPLAAVRKTGLHRSSDVLGAIETRIRAMGGRG